jgi:hypothetical protein
MRIESWVRAWVGVTAVLSLLFAGVIAAEAQQYGRFQLPANVTLLHDIELAIQFIYDRSPSFRDQLTRIAEADHLRVTVQIDPSIPSRCRAFTIIQRRGQKIRAEIHLPPSSDHAELLAHELEHILEQIEGLDLKSLARVRNSGVHEQDYAVFETDRAQAAGRIVKAETRRRGAPAAD